MSNRADALADRIEAGAAALATFADTLTDAEWRTAQPRDGRTIGVIVHHVADIYPVEMDVVRMISGGQAAPVTWDAVAELNAKHARANAAPVKADTLALLKANAKKVADEVRRMSDAELDTAAPLGLSSNAPVTAQYVIEDHPLKHPWHHLYRIRATLKR